MIFDLVSIKDELSGYASPVTMENVDMAERYLAYLKGQEGMIKSSPKDFSIWRVGTFDTETGKVQSMVPELIVRGDSLNG